MRVMKDFLFLNCTNMHICFPQVVSSLQEHWDTLTICIDVSFRVHGNSFCSLQSIKSVKVLGADGTATIADCYASICFIETSPEMVSVPSVSAPTQE